MSEVLAAAMGGAAHVAATVNAIEENKAPFSVPDAKPAEGWATWGEKPVEEFDVAATMLGRTGSNGSSTGVEPTPGQVSPVLQVVDGGVVGKTKRTYTRRSKTPPPPPSPTDQLRQLITDSKFGMIAVACEAKMFEACNAPPLNKQESEAVERATNALLVHMMKDSPNAAESVPFIAFAAAVGAPILLRSQPIYTATKGFWDAVGEQVGKGMTWIVSKFKRPPELKKAA
jgi:hypothetical protein